MGDAQALPLVSPQFRRLYLSVFVEWKLNLD